MLPHREAWVALAGLALDGIQLARDPTSGRHRGVSSHRRDCHSAAPHLLVVGGLLEMGRGRQQNDSLADG